MCQEASKVMYKHNNHFLGHLTTGSLSDISESSTVCNLVQNPLVSLTLQRGVTGTARIQ
jgi:hypothetical protein